MNDISFKSFSDQNLLDHAQNLAASERKIYSEILQVLAEIESRKLYLARGYPSLFAFCTEYLHYSAGSAQRRIESMRLLKSLPPQKQTLVKEKLQKGSLNLSHLSGVSKLVRERSQRMTALEKIQVLSKVENTTQIQCEKVLASLGAKPKVQREHMRAVSATEVRLAINLDEETAALLEELMQLTAHQNPWGSKEVAIKMALRIAVAQVRKKKGELVSAKKKPRAEYVSDKSEAGKVEEELELPQAVASTGCSAADSPSAMEVKVLPSRYIPANLRREVWRRDQGSCTYVDRSTKKKCNARFGLELDHIHEFANGGTHCLENLRLLCAAHNKHRGKIERRSSS